jgi:hypothetical protein
MSDFMLKIRHLLGQTTMLVDIRGGEPEAKKGKVPIGFIQDCKDVVERAGITSGRVYGFADGRKTSLAFTKHFDKSARQRLRNAWGFHEK